MVDFRHPYFWLTLYVSGNLVFPQSVIYFRATVEIALVKGTQETKGVCFSQEAGVFLHTNIHESLKTNSVIQFFINLHFRFILGHHCCIMPVVVNKLSQKHQYKDDQEAANIKEINHRFNGYLIAGVFKP